VLIAIFLMSRTFAARQKKTRWSKVGTSASLRDLRLGIREKGLIAPTSTTIVHVALGVGRAYLQAPASSIAKL